jgi:hypothetical protein
VLEIRGNPLPGNKGLVNTYTYTYTDITDRKQAEERIRQQGQRISPTSSTASLKR